MAIVVKEQRESSQYEKVYIGIDGAGSRAEAIAKETAARISEEFGQLINMGITSHQFFLGQIVSFKENNTAMCFDFDLPVGSAARADEICREMVHAVCDPSDEPGVCVLTLRMEDDGLREDVATHAGRERKTKIKEAYRELIRFGQTAKRECVTLEKALETAELFPEIILSGGGETGRGRIGALACVGLRVAGDDGKFLGAYDMTKFSIRSFGSVAQCIGGFRANYDIDPLFADRSCSALGFHERLHLIPDAAGILDGGRFTVVCALGGDDMWTPYAERDFNRMRNKKGSCDFFELDPDEIERFQETKRRVCSACLYRKLTDEGYQCAAGHTPVK